MKKQRQGADRQRSQVGADQFQQEGVVAEQHDVVLQCVQGRIDDGLADAL